MLTDVEAGKKVLGAFYDRAIEMPSGPQFQSSIASPMRTYSTFESFYNGVGGDHAAWAIGQAAIELSTYEGLSEKDLEETGIRAAEENNGVFNVSKVMGVMRKEATEGVVSGILSFTRAIGGTVEIIGTTEPKKLIAESLLPQTAKDVATGIVEAGQSTLKTVSFASKTLKYLPYIAVAGALGFAALKLKLLSKMIPGR